MATLLPAGLRGSWRGAARIGTSVGPTTRKLSTLNHRNHGTLLWKNAAAAPATRALWNPQQQQHCSFSSSHIAQEETIDLQSLLSGTSSSSTVVNSDNTRATASLVVDAQCELGECILYDDATESILWADILQKQYHTLDLNYDQPNQCQHVTYNVDKKLGAFGLLKSNHQKDHNATPGTTRPLLCAWEDGFQLYDIEQNVKLSPYSQGEDVNPQKGLSRLNDGRTDVLGKRFICGGYFGGDEAIRMKVFAVEQEKSSGTLQHQAIVEDIQITNSLCFSPDGRTMYLADSPTKQIYAYDYNNSHNGEPIASNKTLLQSKEPNTLHGVPDGSCVDREGYLWNAVWRTDTNESGLVQRVDPQTGEVVFTVDIPHGTSQVSCCCFGGRNLDILFITTAAEFLDRDASNQPHAGGLYAVQLPFQGRPEARLDFSF